MARVIIHSSDEAELFTESNPGHVEMEAGDAALGTVAITSIAAGDNNIGNVDVASIAAGDNNIGNVDLASAIPAGTNYIGKVATNDDLVEITLSLDTSQYASGDVLAATQEISSALLSSGGQATLMSLVLLDKDDQGGALDLVIFRSDAAMGAAENATLAITDANAAEIIDVINIVAGDYTDLVNSQIVVKRPADLGTLLEATTGTSLYIAAISRDTKTYTAAGIVIKLGLAART